MSSSSTLTGRVLRRALTWFDKRRLPPTSGEVHLPGLSAPVDVRRDRWGVPHIEAANLNDLLFAQGVVHTQDRLWQMELNRRTATGRLSELFGAIALDTDRVARTFGWARLAQTDWDTATDQVRAAITAYTAGVNAWLNHPSARMPIEFTLLRHKPEPWTPLDSLAWARVMIWQLSHAWYGEIIRAQLIEAVGPEKAAELDIHYPEGNPATLPAGIEFNRLAPDGTLRGARGPFLGRGLGSNAWTLAGRKTTTGQPILCNDMHLPLGAPSLWYQTHLRAENYHVSGVSLPGLPVVLVGHNDHVAWGMTLAYTDCEDLFIEEFEANTRRYRVGAEWREADVVREAIRVKGRSEPHMEDVIVTRHGPIISDVVGASSKRLAVNSMALRPCPAVQGWLALNRATNWDDFVNAMHLIEAPQLNVAYADVEGNIGYWCTGRVPVRAKGDGTTPAPGWSNDHEWIGEVPFEEMPHALNPQQGYVVTCNHRLMPADYPHFLGNVWMNGYRARRIVEVLNSREKLSAADCRALHQDFTCLPGREVVDHLRTFTTTDPDGQLVLDQLYQWNGQLTPDSIGGAIYEVLRYRLVRNLLEPGLGNDLTTRLMGQGFHPLLMPAHEFYGHDTVVVLRMLEQSESWWVTQAGGRDAWITRSLQQTAAWLRNELGADVSGWQWGRIHRASFPHALGVQPPLDQVFSRGPLPIGGDTDTPCQTAMAADDPYDNKAWAPSFRQIVDLGDLSRSVIIHTPGQSGQIGSAHYDDLADLWIKGEYIPMLWTREQVQAETRTQLALKPGSVA